MKYKFLKNFLFVSVLSGCSASHIPVTDPVPSVVDVVSETSPTISRFAGKPTALFFWSSWCRVCVLELPAIDRLARTMQPEGLNVVAIAMMDSKEAAEAAMKGAGFHVPVILDPEARIGKELGVNGLPAMVLLDSHGNIQPMLGATSGPRNWDDPNIREFLRGFLKASVSGKVA